jgi:AbrB family looped-hinge helix DNA binding protein
MTQYRKHYLVLMYDVYFLYYICYYSYMLTHSSIVTSKGTITLPASFRRKANIKNGTKVTISMRGNTFIVKPLGTWEDFSTVRDSINEKFKLSNNKMVTPKDIEQAKTAYYKEKINK